MIVAFPGHTHLLFNVCILEYVYLLGLTWYVML